MEYAKLDDMSTKIKHIQNALKLQPKHNKGATESLMRQLEDARYEYTKQAKYIEDYRRMH